MCRTPRKHKKARKRADSLIMRETYLTNDWELVRAFDAAEYQAKIMFAGRFVKRRKSKD